MSFFQQSYEFKKLLQDIEKLTTKCVHFNVLQNIYISNKPEFFEIPTFNLIVYCT